MITSHVVIVISNDTLVWSHRCAQMHRCECDVVRNADNAQLEKEIPTKKVDGIARFENKGLTILHDYDA